MNLDDIKKNWKEIDTSSTRSNLSAPDLKLLIEKRKKKNRIRMLVPEALIILLYLYLMMILIIFNHQFDSSILKALSWLDIVILICQVAVIYDTFRIFHNKMILSNAYHQTLELLESECEKLNSRYYLILGLNLIILLLCIILLPRIYSENPSIQQLFMATIVGVLILSYLSYRIYKYYKNLILQNNYLLKRLKTG